MKSFSPTHISYKYRQEIPLFYIHDLCLSSDYSFIAYLQIIVYKLAASSDVNIKFHALVQTQNLVYQINFYVYKYLTQNAFTRANIYQYFREYSPFGYFINVKYTPN